MTLIQFFQHNFWVFLGVRQLNIPCTDIFKKMKKCDLDLLHDLFFCSICHAKLGESVAMRSIVFYLLLFHSVIALKLVGMEGFSLGFRQWSFVADMDCCGALTLNDVMLWFKWLYFYPGDLCILLLANLTPNISQFLGISLADFFGWLSGGVSAVFWILASSIFEIVFSHGGDEREYFPA